MQTTKRTAADPALPPAKKQRVQHRVRVPGRLLPSANAETVMWAQMHAIGLRGHHVERLINKRTIRGNSLAIINKTIAECTKREIYPSGYEFGLLVHVAEHLINAMPVEEPEYDAPLEEKKHYLTKIGFPAAFVDAVFRILPAAHTALSDCIELAYDFSCIGARIQCMELEGGLKRGWFDDAINDPSLFSDLDHRPFSDLVIIEQEHPSHLLSN